MKTSPFFLQNCEKNLLYQNEQQTISMLRSETNSLYDILEKQRENNQKELETLVENFKFSSQITDEKCDSLRIELENANKINENLKELLENAKKIHSGELKKLRFEINNSNRFITEKQKKFNEEKKRLEGEIIKFEGVLAGKEANYKKNFENKLMKLLENLEEKTKIINYRKNFY